MLRALIGHSGFVGGTLLRQARFDALYRSTDIASIAGGVFDLVVCAGASAAKGLANREPAADRASIERLTAALASVRCRRFVLISTVDVFRAPRGVDEDSPVGESGLSPYGAHRLRLERFVQDHFPDALIIRLPGLVGPGLRKNVLFDLHNSHALGAIDSRGRFQFYPMINLWPDIEAGLAAGLSLLHLTAPPLSIAEVAREGFGRRFDQALAAPPIVYDLRSRHAELSGGRDGYHYSRRESLLAIRAYAQSEPLHQTGPWPDPESLG